MPPGHHSTALYVQTCWAHLPPHSSLTQGNTVNIPVRNLTYHLTHHLPRRNTVNIPVMNLTYHLTHHLPRETLSTSLWWTSPTTSLITYPGKHCQHPCDEPHLPPHSSLTQEKHCQHPCDEPHLPPHSSLTQEKHCQHPCDEPHLPPHSSLTQEKHCQHPCDEPHLGASVSRPTGTLASLSSPTLSRLWMP